MSTNDWAVFFFDKEWFVIKSGYNEPPKSRHRRFTFLSYLKGRKLSKRFIGILSAPAKLFQER